MFDWFMEWLIIDYSDLAWWKIYIDIVFKLGMAIYIPSYVFSFCVRLVEDSTDIDEEIIKRLRKLIDCLLAISLFMMLIPALGFICYWIWAGLCWFFDPVTALFFVLLAVTIAGIVFSRKVRRKLNKEWQI